MSMVADFPKALVESCMEKRTEITPLENQGEREIGKPLLYRRLKKHMTTAIFESTTSSFLEFSDLKFQ